MSSTIWAKTSYPLCSTPSTVQYLNCRSLPMTCTADPLWTPFSMSGEIVSDENATTLNQVQSITLEPSLSV